jgi:hypothetical protein
VGRGRGCSEVWGKVGSPSRPIPRIFRRGFWVRSPGQVRSPAGRTKARVSRLAARADALLWFWPTDPCVLCSAFHQIAHGEACRSEENVGCSLPDQQASVLKPWAVVTRGWFRVQLPSPVRQVRTVSSVWFATCQVHDMHVWSGIVLDGGYVYERVSRGNWVRDHAWAAIPCYNLKC